jgi:hypothetical protein
MGLYPLLWVCKHSKSSSHLSRVEEVAFAAMAVVKLNLSLR